MFIHMYRIASNFQGAKFSRMVLYKHFAEIIFVVQGFLTYSANSILCPPPLIYIYNYIIYIYLRRTTCVRCKEGRRTIEQVRYMRNIENKVHTCAVYTCTIIKTMGKLFTELYKFSRLATNPWLLRKFSGLKMWCCMVYHAAAGRQAFTISLPPSQSTLHPPPPPS